MRARATAAAALVLLALAAGCGADDEGAPIPSQQAAELTNQLDRISERIANGSAGACRDVIEGTDTNVDSVQRIIDSLPGDVDADVRAALQQSFDRLFELVGEKCADLEQTDTTETEPPPTDTEPTNTEPPPTDTEPTDTGTTTIPTTPETPTTPTSPDGDSGGDGSGGAGVPGDGG